MKHASVRSYLLAAGMIGLLLPAVHAQGVAARGFVRGDADADGQRNISDAVYMLGCSFLGSPCPTCTDAADVDDNGERNLSDPIYLLNFLFLGGPEAPAPGGSCGPDPTVDELDCAVFAPCSNPDAIATSRGPLVVVPIEHASVVLLWDGKAIWCDPVGGAALYDGLPRPDVVVITHTHSDHMDAATLRAVVTESTVLVVPATVAQSLGASVLDLVDERVLANGETTDAGDIGIEAVPMYNLTADRLRFHAEGDGNGYVLDLDGTRIYVAGDTEDIPEMRTLEDIDLAFLCMNLPFTMTPSQAASAALEFQPRVVYPYHYRGQDPQVFKDLVEAGSDAIEVRLREWYP